MPDISLSLANFKKPIKIIGSITSGADKFLTRGAAALFLLSLGTQNLQAAEHHTKKALIEVNDIRADRNPVKSIRADTWKVVDVKGKIKPQQGQAVAVICEGDFPVGMIANDLIRSNGEFNREFHITALTTVRDICNQQEDAMRVRNPRLFK